jgi:hypothetical protein
VPSSTQNAPSRKVKVALDETRLLILGGAGSVWISTAGGVPGIVQQAPNSVALSRAR